MIITAVRLYLTYKVDFSDLSYSVLDNMFLTTVQPGVAVMVASGPLLKPVLDRLLGDKGRDEGTGGSSSMIRKQPRSQYSRAKSSNNYASRWLSAGFSRMTESEQNLNIELANTGIHEAQVSVQNNHTKGRPEHTIGPEGIMVTRQTMVATD